MVTVIPYKSPNKKQQHVGFLKGHIKIPTDFDRMGETEIIEIFEGKV